MTNAGQNAPDPARRDFPFYDGRPRRLSTGAWITALAMCAVAFAALEIIASFGRGPWMTFLGMSAFGLCNLAGLRLAAGRDWAAAFHALSRRDVAIGLLGAVGTMIASGIAGAVVFGALHGAVSANPAMGKVAHLAPPDLALFMAGSAIQLVGEEVLTLVPFLAILTLVAGRLGRPRTLAIGAAWLGSALIFAAVHLPTYDWQIVQTLAVIGVARLVLTIPYLVTKTLWSSVIAHIANDWGLMLIVIAFAR